MTYKLHKGNKKGTKTSFLLYYALTTFKNKKNLV